MIRNRGESYDLTVADKHIERCLQLIRAQEGRVQRAKSRGMHGVTSERLLTLLRETADVMAFHRAVMEGKPADGSGSMRRPEAETFDVGSSQPHPPLSTLEPVIVLLVDDDPNVLAALEAIVAAGGYEVVTAENGKDALEKARGQPPDVVVSDVMMPVMDGPGLVGEMAADGRLSDIPVVLNSAQAPPPPVHVDAFLKKPYAPGQLLDLIRHLVEEHRCGVTGAMGRR
ncbi:response regulator [Trinickia sp. EG282A]|uniref:response regulator n=1 Tax=Trinickia sp. EG282A TaxID=3237013 RepID=UPI0034D1EF88